MTQNNLYMEDDEMRLYVDVQPLFIDELENSKNAAAASAAAAAQSEAAASNWKNDIEDYKTDMELFYAQASDELTDLYEDSISEIATAKNNAIGSLQTQNNTIIGNINTAKQSAINNIAISAQGYVNQARSYAEQAQDTVDNRVSLEHLNQSKALETGDVSDDSDVLGWINCIAHSTFDLSKFTAVGSPTITNDGIASGFSSTNFLKKTNLSITPTSKIVIKGAYIFNTTSGETIPIVLKNGNSKQMSIGISANKVILRSVDPEAATIVTTNFLVGDYIEFIGTITATELKIEAKVNGVSLTTVTEETTYTFTTIDKFSIGGLINTVTNQITNVVTGSIPLKQLSIIVDGVEVFNGNKTGIDMVKPDDYTVVGTPTISADGIASGFSASNHIYTDNLSSLSNGSFEIISPEIIYNTAVASGDTEMIYAINGTNNHISTRVNGSNLGFLIKGNTVEFIRNFTAIPITIGNIYQTKIRYNSTTQKISIYYKVNRGDWIAYLAESSAISTFTFIDSDKLYIGSESGSGSFITNVPIDLNGMHIYSNGSLVYQPCLKIPYTESKTGSKIVHVAYRDRVTDIYQQFGYAPYYTLGDTDFTLPMGEIYGMIENLRKLIIERTTTE